MSDNSDIPYPSFTFDLTRLLREPLQERLYFSELTPDWVLLTLERLMPPWWEVNGARYLPGVTREKMGGRFDPANYFYFRVIVGEVEVGPGVMWVARNGYGELDNDKCETVMICEAMREPGRWQLNMICYMEYAGATFHELVQRLREAGGRGDAPAEKAQSAATHNGRPRGVTDDVRWRAQLFKRIKDEHPGWSMETIARCAWRDYHKEFLAHGFAPPTRQTVYNDLIRGEKWRA